MANKVVVVAAVLCTTHVPMHKASSHAKFYDEHSKQAKNKTYHSITAQILVHAMYSTAPIVLHIIEVYGYVILMQLLIRQEQLIKRRNQMHPRITLIILIIKIIISLTIRYRVKKSVHCEYAL